MYIFLAILYLWLFHCATIFWGVMWPYHYSVSKSSGRTKYYHILAAILSIALPLVSVVSVQFSKGFVQRLPITRECGITTPKASLFSLIMPVNIILIAGVMLLVITLWKIANVVSIYNSTLLIKLLV